MIFSSEGSPKKDFYFPLSEFEEKDYCLVDLSVILGSLKDHRAGENFKENLSYSLEAGEDFYITQQSFERFNEGISSLKNRMKNQQGYKNGRSKHYLCTYDKRFLNAKRKIDLEQRLSDLFYEKKKIIHFKGAFKIDYNFVYSKGLDIENNYEESSMVFDFLISGLTLSKRHKVNLLSNNLRMADFIDNFLLKNSSDNYNINLFARVDEDNFERLV